jgi:hypothetical protein
VAGWHGHADNRNQELEGKPEDRVNGKTSISASGNSGMHHVRTGLVQGREQPS